VASIFEFEEVIEWTADPHEVKELITLGIKALKKYLAQKPPAHPTTLKGSIMANYQLTEGDSVVITLTDTDDVTGEAVIIDPGSVTAELSDLSDSVVVDPSGTFLTLTAGSVDGLGNTVTVNATVGGVSSVPWTGTYDVVANVVTPDSTTLSGTFGTEEAPVATDGSGELLTNGQALGGRPAEA
jgi:hypothetical protein